MSDLDQPSPYELWQRAAGDRDRYLELLRQHGHLVALDPCPICGATFRHGHTSGGEAIGQDIFGHEDPDARIRIKTL